MHENQRVARKHRIIDMYYMDKIMYFFLVENKDDEWIRMHLGFSSEIYDSYKKKIAVEFRLV